MIDTAASFNPDAFYTYVHEIALYPLLSAQEEKDLFIRLANGDAHARQKIIESNLRLVVHIVKKFTGAGAPQSLILDFIQEGNVGLMRAIEKFDYTKGFKFSTYATWWIRQAIGRVGPDLEDAIRLPCYVHLATERIKRARSALFQEGVSDPTHEEIAERCHMSVEEVGKMLRVVAQPMSLDAPAGEAGDATIADVLEATPLDLPVSRSQYDEILRPLLQNLSAREQKLFDLRFGLSDGESRTLEEVGQVFGVCRERVRQIEDRAFEKIRAQLKLSA